jgi:hypothetical protein
MMDEQDILSAISEFYVVFYINISEEAKGHTKESCLPGVLRLNSNKLRGVIERSKKSSHLFRKEVFEFLLDRGYIVETNSPNQYVISTKGIWFYEIKKKGVSDSYIYDYITNWKYKEATSKVTKGITDEQIMLLFAMFSMRCFSKECSVSIVQNDKLNYWKEIFRKCIEFLQSRQFTKSLNSEKIIEKEGTKSFLALLVLNNCTILPKLTKSVFSFVQGSGIFYLDVLLDSRDIEKNKLVYIFERIFNKLSIKQKEDILEFSKSLLKEYDSKIFDNLQNSYTRPKDSLVIEEIILLS